MKFTYGAEIEFVDADRSKMVLPSGCKFNEKEVTLVNSNGVAVNSLKNSKNFLGGEINTPATLTLDDQLEVIKTILKLLKDNGARINYRCNLHTHIGLPLELQTVDTLKKIQKYAFVNFEALILATMGSGQFHKKPQYPNSFWSHYKERMVPQYKHDFLMASETLKDFQLGFFKTKLGTHAPLTFMRQLVNTHSFFKTKTIEYRGWWATLDLWEIKNCFEFHQLLIEMALEMPEELITDHWPKAKTFPRELLFSSELERGFQATKVAKP